MTFPDLSPWKPAAGVTGADRYRAWLMGHPHLALRARRELAGKDFPPVRWPGDVLSSIANDGGPAKDPVFVFGSNSAGRHGRGAAFFARKQRGAEYGVGEGLTGNAYAIPTKEADLLPRSIADIGQSVATFLQHARAHPDEAFEVTRVGCGLAGYKDVQIAPLFESAPPNVDLPYRWRMLLGEATPARVIVASSVTFNDASLLNRSLDLYLSQLDGPVIVVGGNKDADELGSAYAMRTWGDREIPYLTFPAEWDRYGESAGMIRNQQMSRAASHLVAFHSETSSGAGAMIRVAQDDGLSVRVVKF